MIDKICIFLVWFWFFSVCMHMHVCVSVYVNTRDHNKKIEVKYWRSMTTEQGTYYGYKYRFFIILKESNHS